MCLGEINAPTSPGWRCPLKSLYMCDVARCTALCATPFDLLRYSPAVCGYGLMYPSFVERLLLSLFYATQIGRAGDVGMLDVLSRPELVVGCYFTLAQIDRYGVDTEKAVDKISRQLLEHDVVTENYGGHVPIVPVRLNHRCRC